MNTTLRYTILILGSAYGTQNARLGLQFCEALIQKNQKINALFFYMDGVQNANVHLDPANDELDIATAWQQFSQTHQIPLQLCYSAARRRGITATNCHSFFELSGLGSLSESLLSSDRVLQF